MGQVLCMQAESGGLSGVGGQCSEGKPAKIGYLKFKVVCPFFIEENSCVYIKYSLPMFDNAEEAHYAHQTSPASTWRLL